jgi:hypothetical protein
VILQKIISGGQTGVDQAALQVAWELGYQTGGTAPYGYKTDVGANPQLLRFYGLKESPYAGYRVRTIQNVLDADATCWFGWTESPGGKLTLRTAHERGRLAITNPCAVDLRAFLDTHRIVILNVAGNRKRTHPEAAELAAATLALALVDHSLKPLR